jgi:hypothetical protein
MSRTVRRRNPVAKFAHRSHRASVHPSKKDAMAARKPKHRNRQEYRNYAVLE